MTNQFTFPELFEGLAYDSNVRAIGCVKSLSYPDTLRLWLHNSNIINIPLGEINIRKKVYKFAGSGTESRRLVILDTNITKNMDKIILIYALLTSESERIYFVP